MRVLCTSTPMEGVVGPPIAHALRDRGHEVLLAAGPDVQGRVEGAELEATVVGPTAMEAVMRTMSDPAAAESPGAGPTFGAVMFGEVFAPDLLPQLRAIADQFVPDAVVHPPVEVGLAALAAPRGIPSVTYGFGQLLDDAMVRALADRVAPLWEAAGLIADDHAGIYRDCFLDPCPSGMRLGGPAPARVLQAIRPEIPGATSDRLPTEIASLGDRPLLYVTLGTVPIFNQLAMFEVLLDAVAEEDIDVVATVGANNDPAALASRPGNVHAYQWLPLRPLLERCDAVMCHGGSGTTLAALSVALPLVVVPLGADQFENAFACEKAGTACVVRPADTEALAVRDAVRAVMDPQSSERRAAQRLADEIAAMPEPFDAMAIIETLAE
jgi:UDP:flavonoid glycosyltransferase YjiC (YdhE family)